MKKTAMIWAVLSGVTFLAAGIGNAATLNVCGTCAYTNIQPAVTAASDGDTIMAAAGAYTESVTVDKHLTIKGHSAADTFVNVSNPADHGFIIIAPDVNLSGFNIQGGTNVGTCGIIIGGTAIYDAVDHHVSGVVIQKCIVEKSDIGIMVWRSGDTKILNNTVRYCTRMSGDGIGIGVWSDSGGGSFSVTDTVISNNAIYDNDLWGVDVETVGSGSAASFAGMQVTNNTLYNNGAYDDVAPGNKNTMGMYFANCTGPIKVNNNKVLTTTAPGNEFFVDNITVHGLTGTGNKTYTAIKPSTLKGAAAVLAVP